MPLTIATHNGPFHADDVMAAALIREFLDSDAQVVRTRDPEVIDKADIVVDVGGSYDPDKRRFDHHQAAYEGPLSSAGMVLKYVHASGVIDDAMNAHLRDKLVDYLDAVDNGRRAPEPGVPCFPVIIDAMNQPCSTQDAFDAAFEQAVPVARALVHGLRVEQEKFERDQVLVKAAMDEAVEQGRGVLFFESYLRWKQAYFRAGGETHPTAYTLFPGTDGSWRVIAIPPAYGSFAQKNPLPQAWAGLTDEALEQASGIKGAVFCHKNLFIAVFKTREGAIEALRSTGRLAPFEPA